MDFVGNVHTIVLIEQEILQQGKNLLIDHLEHHNGETVHAPPPFQIHLISKLIG